MKLTTRFIILTGILGLAVIVSLGVAYWGVATVDREVRTTYGDITDVLSRIELIKRNFESQTQTLRRAASRSERSEAPSVADEASTPDPGRFEGDGGLNVSVLRAQNASTRHELSMLNQRPAFGRFTGMQTSSVMTRQILELANQIERCAAAFESGDTQAFYARVDEASEPFERLHLMIESLEGRMLEDLDLSLENARMIRSQVNLILLLSLGAAALIIALVLLLQRRWFIQPIAALREATVQLSHGNFEHRIPIQTRDELGLLSREVNDMAGTITEIQQRLIDRERLAAIGEMMRRIVHNLRNPLAGIRSLAELTRSELDPESDEHENQQRILSTVDRFETWLEEVLHSTRPLEVKPEPIQSRPFFESLLEPQRDTARGRSVQFDTDFTGMPELVSVDTVHFEHALVALVANAIEACPEGGIVRVAASEMRSETKSGNGRIDAHGVKSDGIPWRLIVEDSGDGIDEELQHRIFEPYFTTKRHGSGIGLAVVRNVVQAHGGQIAVDRSELGGARFIVTLPC